MFDFSPDPELPKPVLYSALAKAAGEVTRGERDGIANMANIAALIWQFVPDINWAGFYRMESGELVLGPFTGRPACVRISLGQGVCGTAAASGGIQLVADVHDFAGHIACDPQSRSELVAPVLRDGRVVAVIDIDSPIPGRFDAEDAAGIELLARLAADVV